MNMSDDPSKRWFSLHVSLLLVLFLAALAWSVPQSTQAVSRAELAQPTTATAVNTAPSLSVPSLSAPSATACVVAGVGHHIYLPITLRPAAMGDTPATPADPLTTDRELKYVVGKTYTYAYQLSVLSQSTSADAENSQNSNGMAIGVTADVDLAITDKTATGVSSGRLILRNVVICNADGTGRGTVVEDAELMAELGQPILFEQDDQGVILAVSYPVASSDTAVNIQKGVLNSLQITLKGNDDTYTVEEAGGQGVYEATYQLAEDTGGLNLSRTFNQDSFASLLFTGDENTELLLHNQSAIFLDATLGVLTSVHVTEQIISADQSDTPPSTGGDQDGNTASSGAFTKSKLLLHDVTDTPADAPLLTLRSLYVSGGMGAVLTDDGRLRPGIDLDEVDLEAEFEAFEAEPDNPELVQRLSDLMDAADDDAVKEMLVQRLEASSDVEKAKAYIDILGVNGTPGAQALLLPAVQKAYGQDVQEHALIALVTQRKVAALLLPAVQAIVEDPNDPLNELAWLVLGAIADTVEDPAGGLSRGIKEQLRQGLDSAGDDETRILFLDAIGNANDLDALSLIEGYLDGSYEFEVREAAIHALRKLPAGHAEPLLIGLLNNPDEDPLIREIAANVLRGRRPLTPAATAALTAYEEEGAFGDWFIHQPDSLNFKRTWNKHLGGNKLGIDLPGSVSATEYTNPNRISLIGRQEAVAHAWSFKYNLAMAELVSQRKGDKQEMKITFSLMNNKIKKNFDVEVQCAANKSANLYKATHTLIDLKTKIPVWGIISVDLGIRATGSIALDYTYSIDVCNPAQPRVGGSITPSVSATLEGYAALSIQILRGGASVSGTLLNTSVPVQLTAKRTTAFELCIDIKVKTKPLTIAVKLFAERRKLTGGWKRFFEKTLFKYETPQKEYPLLVSCLK